MSSLYNIIRIEGKTTELEKLISEKSEELKKTISKNLWKIKVYKIMKIQL